MFANKGKYSETRLDSGPAATPCGVDLPLVNGSDTDAIQVEDMDPDSSVLCDTQVSSNSNANASDKTILLEEFEDGGANKSLDSSVSFQVPNINQNFALNVAPSVGNIAAIQNVIPSGSPTLWLPTIITSNTPTTSDETLLESQVEGSSNSLSQIIFSGNGTHSNPTLTTSNVPQPINKYTPKVQIFTIPKQGSLSQAPPISCIKTVMHTTYVNPNDVKTRNTSSFGNSVLNNQLVSGTSQPHDAQTKSISVSSSGLQLVNMPSTTNRISGKGNGSSIHQTHVLSRVVPGPKLSAQSLARSVKNNNTMQFHKTPGSTTNLLQPQAVQSPMSVKIVQQQNVPSNNKSALKSVPPSRSGTLTTKQRGSTSNSTYNQTNIHKQGSHSKCSSGVSVTKPVGRNLPQRLVVQQTPSRLMMSSNVGSQSNYNRTTTHYYQQSSNDTDNIVRYNSHHNYMNMDSGVSSNQSLTAQILQSLSHPKTMNSRLLPTRSSVSPVPYDSWEDNVVDTNPYSQYKQIQGDPSTLRVQDDTLGIEERPNLPDDSLSHHYYRLQLVMLDHTYAVTPQSIAASSSSNISTTPVINTVVSSTSHVISNSPTCSPVKTLPSPTKCQSPLPVSPPIENNYNYTNITCRRVEDADDDAGSVLSSIDGDDRRQGERNGSDTETAPEGEGEEEGKTRCVCDFTHDDGYMICCDRCGEWQHVDCMAIDRQNIPDDYMCDRCQPRLIDRKRARSIQMRKKVELTGLYSSASDSSSGVAGGQKKLPGGRTLGPQKKLVTVTTYSNTIGGVSRTLPMLPPQQSSSFSAHTAGINLSPVVNKRGPKRTRRVDNGRKGPKRKLPDKKVRRKSEVTKYRNKYCANLSQQINQWSESYEQAMTNHYSPELRAKIARYFSNKQGTNHTAMSSALTAHFCTTVPHAGSKILIATKDMKENCPIIELRGKYMLSTQHKPQPQPAGRAGSQRPGPYLFFYKFPKDTTQVCIDTRTYGNEARFVRRSCKPNAELQHCIIKGALHVYMVTISPIQSNTEITIRHETSGSYQPCACGNPKHCKQSPAPCGAPSNVDIIHKNNSASLDSRERRGRARRVSSSATNLPSTPKVTSPHGKEISSPKVDKRRKSEPESVAHNNIKHVDDTKSFSIKVEPNLESDLDAIKGIDIKDEFKSENITTVKDNVPSIKQEKIVDELKPTAIEKIIEENDCKNEVILKNVKVETPDEITESSKPTSQPLMSPVQSSICENTPQKSKDPKVNRAVATRRTSTHSVRTTRASISASNAAESADEKSDSQTDCKVTAKDKKKMTREERKMEAIVKAIERMEKAEQRKLENKDKQTKRRESDPQQSCSVTSSSESKDLIHPDQPDDPQRSNVKGRPRRRGRSRTTSQGQMKNASRMNSVDSDNVCTSEDEHHPLMSPPRKSITCDNYLDTDTPSVPVSSTESSYQALTQTDAALKQSFDRIKFGLSSVCLLVEAAVGPLETTFKSPKTKKAIMNEWLNKSPEANMSYDMGSPDYTCTDNNNTNTNDHYTVKPSYMGVKSTESLVKVASTMIGNLSGGIISADSTPEKNSVSDPSDGEHPSLLKNIADCYSPPPVTYPQRNLKRVARDLSRDTGEKNRTPKKMRRGVKNLDPSPLKRSLRSGGGEIVSEVSVSVSVVEGDIQSRRYTEFEQPNPVVKSSREPPPPQHSAKKRWLRQAISEESDSPTAESPPNEMLTPLKKRRLARESLTSESSFIQNDDIQCPSLPHTPIKDANNEALMLDNIKGEDCTIAKVDDKAEAVTAEPVCTQIVDGSIQRPDELSVSNICEENVISQGPIDNKIDESSVIDGCLEPAEICKVNESDCVVEKSEISDSNTSNSDKSLPVAEPKSESESVSNVHSTETSCNSSPVLDEMDDIQKKIHSFHTENIQILKIRNKKQPKEKRKKVNLNFDLSVLDDQTVEVKLKSDKDVSSQDEQMKSEPSSGDACTETTDSKTIGDQGHSTALAESTDTLSLMEDEKEIVNATSDSQTTDKAMADVCNIALNNNFPSTVLFSDAFRNKTCLLEPESSTSVPDIDIIKNVIDMTVNLENSVFKDAGLNTVDEYKNVEEILSRVNQMDSRNSVLLSGLMKDNNSRCSFIEEALPSKVAQLPRSNDPRLNPPLCDKPKPIRRKLSITEYRRRHSMVHPSESSSSPTPVAEPSPQPPLSEDEEDMTQFEKKLEASITKLDTIMSNMNMGILNTQPTVHEKQREKLSERLRREFGLAIPEEDVACAPVVADKKVVVGGNSQEREEEGISVGLPLPLLPDPPTQVHLDG